LEWSYLSETETEKKEKPVKLEKVAEETGELIGKGVRKTWNVAKSFGKGLATTIEKNEERKDVATLTCPHCDASIQQDSIFCASCGKKL